MRTSALFVGLFLAGCGGGPSFDGSFTGSFQGQPVSLSLKRDGKSLNGTIRWAGLEGSVKGSVDGDRATGAVRSAGYEADFEATLRGDELDWAYTRIMGMDQRIPISFRREGAGGREERGPGVDPQLVGRWYTEVIGGGASGNTVTTRIQCALNADGTYLYGGGQSTIHLRENFFGPGSVGGTGTGAVTRGQWKCEGQVLYARPEGGQWVTLGRYALSGNDLMVYGPDGSKNLWSRE